VVLQFGEYSRTVGPGLRFALWPVETMERLKVESENRTNFGENENTGLMLAGDQNLVDIRFAVLWKIDDPKAFLFNLERPELTVSAVAESAMREVVGRTPAETVRTTGRLAAQDEVLKITQETLKSYNAGILITAIRLERADPPAQVVNAFEEVQRAEQNQANLINQANQYANQKARSAEGEATRITEDALAYKASAIAQAQGESQRFLKVLDEYGKAKDVTRQRLFLETMEGVLQQSNKVVIEGGQGGSGVVPYLPLPEIQKRQDQTNTGATQQ
jgi:modulator of FtsH protease HflK